MNEVRALAKQTVIYGFGTIVARFLNYGILTFVYTRIFDKGQYGIVTELYAWMVFLLIILTYGMETGFFRFSQKKEDYERVYSTSVISLLSSSILFVVLVNIFIQPVSEVLKYSDHPDYIRLFAAIIAIDAFSAIPFARLRKENKAGLFSFLKIFNVIITLLAVIFLFLIAPGIYERSGPLFRKIYNPEYGVGYVFVANLIGSASTAVMLIPVTLKIKILFDIRIWKDMLSYSFPLMIAGLGGAVNETLDKILLRRITGPENGLEVVGEYGAGYKLAVLMSLFIQMFRFAAEPFFFEKAKTKEAKTTYAFVMKYFVIIMLVIYLVINLFIRGFQYIIDIDFRESLIVVPIVSMGYLLYGIYVNHSIWYKLNDLTRYGIYITFWGAAVTILVNVLFIPQFGYMASAWAHIASYGSMIVLSFILASRHYKIKYNMKELIPYFLIAIGMTTFGRMYQYKGIFMEFAVNSLLIISFILYAQLKDSIFTVFFGNQK